MNPISHSRFVVLGAVTVMSFVASGACVMAQEFAGDGLIQEISDMLETAEKSRDLLVERAELAGQRVKLLRDGLIVRRQMLEMERDIQRAEKAGDGDTADELGEKVELKELWLELAEEELSLNKRLGEMLHAVYEQHNEGENGDVKSIVRIVDLQRETLHLHRRLFELHESRNESELARVEERRERLATETDIRFEIFELERTMFWAEREDVDEKEINEIQDSLEDLRQELGRYQEDEAMSDEQREKALPKKRDAGSLPIRLTKDEIVVAGRDEFSRKMSGLLSATCYECHDSASAMGDLDLEQLVSLRPLVVNRKHWINVIEQLRNRSMPPAESAQPTEADRKYMAAWLSDQIQNFDYETVRGVGFEPAKRLTHDEYNNTIRDLFEVDLRPADRFPDDMTASSGFDNSANSLFIQPITMERYVGAAELVAKGVFSDDAARRRLIGNAKRDVGQARLVLKRFVMKAFRRPAEKGELEALSKYFQELVDGGADFDEAMQDVVQATLVSPSFLIRNEKKQLAPRYRINDWELASRLSYFLWASMPDDELFRLAAEQRLHDPKVLRDQVDRMINDPKSSTLGSLFAAQWLGYNDLNRVRPGPIDNPWCTDSLCAAMLEESGRFFHSLVIADEPLERLIDSDYTFLNEELAKHYGIEGIRGHEMRRVDLRAVGQHGRRGGVLGHASVLAITSFPGRTSPVLRGNWILTELLGTPPPPPPPNASDFSERIAENKRLSQRQKLELHRDNPNCYACHSQIDPLGFSLEQYDWFGRYRERNRKLTAKGEFPDGTEFVGLSGLRRVIIDQRRDDLLEQLVRKMMSYALGRQLEYYDEATVREIMSSTEESGRRLRTMIQSIVASDTFQMQQSSVKRSETTHVR